jgi:hypothetical protein
MSGQAVSMARLLSAWRSASLLLNFQLGKRIGGTPLQRAHAKGLQLAWVDPLLKNCRFNQQLSRIWLEKGHKMQLANQSDPERLLLPVRSWVRPRSIPTTLILFALARPIPAAPMHLAPTRRTVSHESFALRVTTGACRDARQRQLKKGDFVGFWIGRRYYRSK